MKFGKEVGANRVVVGTLWRFQEKGIVDDKSFSPASVAFGLYLVDVSNGNRLWREAFEGTQKALSGTSSGVQKQVKMGLRWLSAEELAKHGVKQIFLKFPDI